MKSNRPQKRCPDCPKQCVCGSLEGLEDNHLGGRNHVPGIWLPFCGQDHKQFHVNCRRAGVDFSYTANRSLGLIHALKAMLVGMWMVVELLEKRIKSQLERQSDETHKEECSNKESFSENAKVAATNRDAEQ